MAVLVSYPSKFLLVCSYITPASPIELYHQHLANIRTLIDKYQDIPLCFLGDLNLPDVDWNPSYDPTLDSPFVSHTNKSRTICNEILDLGLFQTNFVKNSLNRTLDLVFFPFDRMGECRTPIAHLLPPDCHHPPSRSTPPSLHHLYLSNPVSQPHGQEISRRRITQPSMPSWEISIGSRGWHHQLIYRMHTTPSLPSSSSPWIYSYPGNPLNLSHTLSGTPRATADY